MEKLLVSIIIPCKDETNDVKGLLDDISRQKTQFEKDIIKITNISPVSIARNTGAKKAKGQILIFVDSDIRLGDEAVLNNLVNPLLEDKSIGSVCSSILIPLDASGFQKRYAGEILHCEVPLTEKMMDIGLATSQCWAIPKGLFFKLGGFNENIIRGEDSELAVRVKKEKYRIVLASNTWCYHPSPDNIFQLVKIQFRNGLGVAFIDIFYPDLNVDIHPKGIIYFSERKTKRERLKRFFLTGLNAVIEIKLLLILSKIFYAAGYFSGAVKYKLIKSKKQKIL